MQRRSFLGVLSISPLVGLLKIKSSEDSDKYFKAEVINYPLDQLKNSIPLCSGSIMSYDTYFHAASGCI